MHGLSELKRRIERLEGSRRRLTLPQVIYTTYGHVADEIVGYVGGKIGEITVLRQNGETADECAGRAFTLTGASTLIAMYSPEPPERVLDPSPAIHPAVAPDAPTGPQIGSPGVGRQASQVELISMGVIPIRPERLID